MFSRGLLGGTSHLCIGQEAVAVGISANLNNDDYVVSSHRGHGHLIAKGGNIQKIFSELMGKVDGYCYGKGGTQHLCAKDIGFYGTNGITGGGIPIATGIALSIKLRQTKQVAVTFFGDGATNQGTFHESLNMASIWNLPILFVCENNLYGMSTHVNKVTNIDDLAKRAEAYNIKNYIVDGMNVIDIFNGSNEALMYVRNAQRPCFVEAKTYRFCGHSKSDPKAYRTKEEEKYWLDKDCIDSLKKQLLSHGYDIEEINKINIEIDREIETSFKLSNECGETPQHFSLEGVYRDA
jgi:pyruvate dehydrogenase E1 component alpha subunit